SEFWISQQKHWCQYCRIYIADNKPQGKKHRENQEKFLRDIYRKEHESRKEAAKTKRELERIEKAAMKQYRRDIALEAPGATSSIQPPTDSAPTKNLGYHDIVYAGSATPLHSSTAPLPAQPVITQTRAPIVEDRGDGTEPVIGEWRPVTPPPLPIILVEKSFPIDSHEELELELVKIKKEEGVDEKNNVVFKKRKFGNSNNKSRNIRKKID
ncbi:6760_t:CDS:2, partial [Dentiscutata heterogama]